MPNSLTLKGPEFSGPFFCVFDIITAFKKTKDIFILSPIQKHQAVYRLSTLFDDAVERIAELFTVRKSKSLSCPSLQFDQRGRVAASALLNKNIIRLNPKLYSANSEYFIKEVVAHELAHILVHQIYRKRVKPHGIEWQYIMQEVFNLAPRVTHNLDTKDLAMASFQYKCNCQTVELSLIRHNKVQRGKQQYICRRCKSPLVTAD
jgi:SprT protein